MSDTEPYLSVVATSRNDDHGGDLAGRTQIFVDTLAAHCSAHDLPVELILVDWNPPADRPPLGETIRWPDAGAALRIRILTVPPDIHLGFAHGAALPLFQMKAKNAAIRRARGRFILATNIDIVLSPTLAGWIARQDAKPGVLYRTERHDVAPPPPAGTPLAETVAFCADHVVRVNQRYASIDRRDGNEMAVYPKRHRIVGHLPLDLLRRTLHGTMPWSAAGRTALAANWQLIRDEFARPHLFTNASGDFMLMDRDSWHAVHGYAEWDIYSFHLDAIFCHQAVAHGCRETILKPPMVAWHIEHARGSGFVPEDPDALWQRLDTAGVPYLTGAQADEIIRALHGGSKPPALNGADWGLAGLDLAERIAA